MGVILDIFQSFGTLPEEMEELKMFTRCSEIEVEQSLSILAEMLSGPVEVSGLNLAMAWATSPSVNSSSDRTLGESGGMVEDEGEDSLKHDVKNSLNISAFPSVDEEERSPRDISLGMCDGVLVREW